jgi:hypothetical protein
MDGFPQLRRSEWRFSVGINGLARELKRRTLTNLYNERPTWLDLAHRRLDEAVFVAYGWSADLSDDELLAKLLALNLGERRLRIAKASFFDV